MATDNEKKSRKRKRSTSSESYQSINPSNSNSNNNNKNMNKSPSPKRRKQVQNDKNKNKNKKYRTSQFDSLNNKNKKPKIRRSRSASSKSSKSSKSTTSPSSPQQQSKISHILLPRMSKTFTGFEKKYKHALQQNDIYQKLLNKINKLKEETKAKKSEKEENDDEDVDIMQNDMKEMEEIKQKMIKIENKYQNKFIDGNLSATYPKDSGGYSVYNFVNNKNHWKKGNLSTKRLSSTKELIRFTMEIHNNIDILRALKQEGEKHKEYIKLKTKWDALVKNKKRTLLLRNFVLKSAKLALKILENKNDKYKFNLEREYKLLTAKILQVYEPDQFEIDEYEFTEDEINNKSLYLTDLEGLSFYKEDWEREKEQLNQKFTENFESNTNESISNDNPPTPSLSPDELV